MPCFDPRHGHVPEYSVHGIGYCPDPNPHVILRYCVVHYAEHSIVRQTCFRCGGVLQWLAGEEADRYMRALGPVKDHAASHVNAPPSGSESSVSQLPRVQTSLSLTPLSLSTSSSSQSKPKTPPPSSTSSGNTFTGTFAMLPSGPSDTGTKLPLKTPSTRFSVAADISFTNASKRWAHKTEPIIALLKQHPSITEFIGTRPCRITFITTMNPAAVIDRGTVVDVELADWYFEKYSLNYIMGMLCHEFAVHPMADLSHILEVEKMMASEKLDVGILKKTVVPSAAGQRDHIFACVFGCPRDNIYREVVLEMAILLIEYGKTAVTELIDCYLMDVASILGTNDHRDKGLSHTETIAAIYNHRRDALLDIVKREERFKALVKYIPTANKTRWDVFGDYGTLFGRLVSGKVSTTCIVTEKERAEAREHARRNPLDSTIHNLAVWNSIDNEKL